MTMTPNQAFAVRSFSPNDALAAAGLLTELGYPSDAASVLARMNALESATDHVFVADFEGDVVGLVGVHVIPMIHADGQIARITTLVVRSDVRSRGVGAALVETVEHFARETGCQRVEGTSGEARLGAHAFYEANGFKAAGKRFLKVLED